jgi:hypothetical protein
LISRSAAAQNNYFFPSGIWLNPAIPSPKQFLGYPIGEWHTRHDRIVEYFKECGQGRAILMLDDPNFLGYWYGTNKLFFNALFFGSLVGSPNFDQEE